jgi:hypothetical protein
MWIEATAAVLVGIALLALVLGPLASRAEVQPVVDDEPVELDETARGVALLALKEIEFDKATGKLSEEDYTTLKARYTRAALEALKADEAGVTGIGAATARREGTAALPCPACGPRPEADAVFCSNCGRQLGRIAS